MAKELSKSFAEKKTVENLESSISDLSSDIRFAQLCARKGALKLEIAGMKRRSAYAICKEEYGMKGSRRRVLAQLQVLIDIAIKEARDRRANSNVDASGVGDVRPEPQER